MSTCGRFRIFQSLLLMLILMWGLRPKPASGGNAVTAFRPISPEELQMTSEPAAPGAPAIILYRQVNRDDSGKNAREDDYFRIKILNEAGRKYGDIEIRFDRAMENVDNIHARTIKPDGSIVDFDGKVFTTTVVKARGWKYLAKTFSLPAITPGCILEYSYTVDLSDRWLIDSHWILSDRLFTKAADFSLKPYMGASYTDVHLRWSWQNMPVGTPGAERGTDGVLRLHVADVPAFVPEDFMPPEDELKERMDFIYASGRYDVGASNFWSGVGERWNAELEKFVGKTARLEDAVGEIVKPNDPPEIKLLKIYARVQQMRNTSEEVEKTVEELKREKEKAPNSAEEVWKRGYGNRFDLNWLFLAMVRAAGFEAYDLMLPDRESYFFQPDLRQASRLDENAVVVRFNGQNIFCDPGSAFTPFGLLPWQETAVQGLKLDKKASSWVPGMIPRPEQSRTQRVAHLTLTDAGDLEGKLTVTYTGIEAARIRREERSADATERKKYLEDAVRESTFAASGVTLTRQPDWKNSELPLVAEFSFTVPGWASRVGRHVLIPTGLFGAGEKHLFDNETRVHPIYVDYPYTKSDEIDIQLPADWKIISVPPARNDEGNVVAYAFSAQADKGTLQLSRRLSVNFILLDAKYYSTLRSFFQQIKSTDDQQVVVDTGEPAPKTSTTGAH